eukprot:CAMPEP_0119107418 /NCGR_PEP_ID=MMETSP1180-20130426/9981_1 /TAXON_ID=3052 ORGANISM="Chlamydomonas cf sp, Strain CCMP681" /NCGR_SAMPLE_ID=MMETSP1180 /ASSEMBLY_ACC=CAM_ASM_000741 /LENGTH=47 /DNA_ID= /DNA_START= /DNA_END= /DNA_ORIENTATION=
MARGAAAPPMTTCNGVLKPTRFCCSITASMLNQTVGTPADKVMLYLS